MKGELVTITTSDDALLPGFYKPAKKRSNKCVVFVHGLTWHFTADMMPEVFGEACVKAGYNFFMFNNRGAGVLTWVLLKNNSKLIGGGREVFSDCVKDIKAAIDFAAKRGSKEITLVGHSTGCQKSVYYQAKTGDKRVKGIVLLGPASDRDSQRKKLGKRFKKSVSHAKQLVKAGHGERMMYEWEDVLSARRYYSLYNSRSVEGGIFNYTTGKMKLLSKIRVPILAVYGENDKYVVRGVKKELMMIRNNARDATTDVVPKASHGFYEKEKEMTKVVLSWFRKKAI